MENGLLNCTEKLLTRSYITHTCTHTSFCLVFSWCITYHILSWLWREQITLLAKPISVGEEMAFAKETEAETTASIPWRQDTVVTTDLVLWDFDAINIYSCDKSGLYWMVIKMQDRPSKRHHVQGERQWKSVWPFYFPVTWLGKWACHRSEPKVNKCQMHLWHKKNDCAI